MNTELQSAYGSDVRDSLSHPTRENVERLEFAILQTPQVDLKTTHALSGGVYARTIHIPAGTVLTGASHKKDHIDIMQGDITVSTDDGMRRLIGQHVLESKAGNKRVGFAHSDTTWTTICQTNLTDLNDIEAELVEEPEKLQTRNLELAQQRMIKDS